MSSWGHDFPFGFLHIPEKDRLRAIRGAGFDAVMIHWREEDGLDALRRFDEVVAAGLTVNTAHFPQDQIAHMWREGETGDLLEAELITALREAGERGVAHMVVHTTRKIETPEPNEIGLRRFAHAAEAAEKYGVNVALENTRFLRYNQYLYDRIDSPQLRFCFDCGHANCFTPGEDPLALFGDRIVTTHLHDNHGEKDEHLLIGEGTIDLRRIFLRLAQLGVTHYNLESRYRPLPEQIPWTMEEYLDRAFVRLNGYAAQARVKPCPPSRTCGSSPPPK